MSKHNVKVAMQYMPLQPHQLELISLAELSGINAHPQVVRILIELLATNVQPAAVYSLLREVCVKSRSQKDSSSKSERSRASRTSVTSDKSAHKN